MTASGTPGGGTPTAPADDGGHARYGRVVHVQPHPYRPPSAHGAAAVTGTGHLHGTGTWARHPRRIHEEELLLALA